MKLSDFIILSAEKALKLQDNNGSFPPGHNGPYHDPETPVRNSGHWLITFAKCFSLTGKSVFRERVVGAGKYLMSKTARPYGHSFHHRNKNNKDRCNGLIGQAWTIEAIAQAAMTLEDESYSDLAEDVFFQHPFNEELGLWHCLEIDGRILKIDETFNHQLWFAACSSLVSGRKKTEAMRRICRFLDLVPVNMAFLKNGLICHSIEGRLKEHIQRESHFIAKVWRKAVGIKAALKTGGDGIQNIYIKSAGYHAFNLYAFALLKQQAPDHAFWRSQTFRKALKYLLSDEFKQGMESNIYGFPYNPPGFEVPFALGLIENIDRTNIIKISQWWLAEQIRRCYSMETGQMDRNTEDPATLTARIYEATRLPDLDLDIQ
ncbi:hypothetical protein BMS3Abin10_01678 [bacterium BMS3Abin10]|nr:hypothetical protein BMS3Abin10_01678 [bacterium BMS3Abin10]GBE39175.1 hypothetical protein BMS3Bbin08_01795 [bacterium BMS3Bbin08]